MNQFVIMGAMVGAAFLGAVGQVMLRMASDRSFMPLSSLIQNWPLYVFGMVYGVAVLINIWAYKAGGKIAVIYPIIALSYIFASLMAWRFFGEQISPVMWVGTAVIVLGVGLIGWGASV